MNELTLDGKTYVSSRRAAEITGYAKDYVGQLCREGRVEARLVGRNWYILESAIREHRFGSEEKPAAQGERAYASSAWEAPRYAAEEPAAIPALSDRAGVNALSYGSISQNSGQGEAIAAEPSSLLTDMQAAWQEWYERREAVSEVPQTAAEPEEVSPELEIPAIEENPLEEEAPAQPIPETTLDLSHTYVNAYEEPEGEVTVEEPEEGIVIEERIREKTSRIGLAITAPLIRSMFIAVMLLSVAVTIVGSGIFEEFSGKTMARSSEIQFLAGVSSYNHK